MTTTDPTARIPLRVTTGTATFWLSIVGFLSFNISPYMISAVQVGLGANADAAEWVVTGSLLATAVTGLAAAPVCAGPHRRVVLRAGLVLAIVAFGAAAFIPAAMIPGLIIGGIGTGISIAAAGAAMAVFRNPNRVAGLKGLSNRIVMTGVLAIIPIMGLVPINVFGALSLFSLLGLILSGWLPDAPIAKVSSDHPVVKVKAPRSITIAGFAILVMFAIWAISEDALWAMAGRMGADQAGLTDAGLGVALSAATAGGILANAVLIVLGRRGGRAIPLAILLIAGGSLKIAEGYVSDATTFIVVFVIWNTLYAIAFQYFFATSAALDVNGRWSGPMLAAYMIGSALTPVIGATLVNIFGYQGFAAVLGIVSFALVIPASITAKFSTRIEDETPVVKEPQPV